MSKGRFKPDAALINYYRSGDTLGGHLDDVEKDMTKPIVSFSLGCDAIFLLGGQPRIIHMACQPGFRPEARLSLMAICQKALPCAAFDYVKLCCT